MAGSILGNAVVRVEDAALIVGCGTFVDNQRPPGVLHACFVRSPLAHAHLGVIDTELAASAPGVVGVFTGADLDLKPSFPFVEVDERCARPPLAVDRVRFVGEPVAVVIAETAAEARDSADLVDVEYAELPCVVVAESALAPGAVQLFEGVPGNLVEGARTSADDALHGAAHVVRARFVNQRMAVAPMEGNAVLAVPGGDYDVTVQLSTQTPHLVRDLIAADFGLAEDRVRVVAPHVGGGFGGKAFANDCRVVVGAALRLQRAVTFAESRPESLLSMQGRAQVQYVELGLDQEGTFTGLRCRMIGDCGAYGGFGGTFVLGPTASMAPGSTASHGSSTRLARC